MTKKFLPQPKLKTRRERIRGERVMITFYTNKKNKEKFEQWAIDHDMTISQALRMGIKMLLRRK